MHFRSNNRSGFFKNGVALTIRIELDKNIVRVIRSSLKKVFANRSEESTRFGHNRNDNSGSDRITLHKRSRMIIRIVVERSLRLGRIKSTFDRCCFIVAHQFSLNVLGHLQSKVQPKIGFLL